MAERQHVVLDPAVASILTPGATPEPERKRHRHITPHETQRYPRRMSLTFPSAEWAEAIREEAERAGVRVSDFVTWCVSQAMDAIERGELARPEGGWDYQDRTGICLRLPWEPE